jgi:3'-5' exoribonuclease
MAGRGPDVVRLSELEHGQEAVCFAALVKKEPGTDKHGKPFLKCHFRDKWVTLVAPFWSGNALREKAETWVDGQAYRLHVRGDRNIRYGMQIEILDGRLAGAEDAADGYDFRDLVESSDFPPDQMFKTIHDRIERYIEDPYLKRLVCALLEEHAALFKKMPAAQNFHHSYTSGLLEHVWSMTRIAGFLADHYTMYYKDLDPPLNKGVVMAAAILHDIGKLRELDYDPVESRYTTEGRLIGHVMIGRDMVRAVAAQIEGFPLETLMLLEHAILAHHGKLEFGAPIVPQTLEALLVSYIDDLDAKINMVARERLLADGDGEFTDKVYPLENRRFYKGTPRQAPGEPGLPPLA